MPKVSIRKDGDWYLAKVEWYDNVFAFWHTKKEAHKELINVVEMMLDYHLELAEKDKMLRNHLLSNKVMEHAL